MAASTSPFASSKSFAPLACATHSARLLRASDCVNRSPAFSARPIASRQSERASSTRPAASRQEARTVLAWPSRNCVPTLRLLDRRTHIFVQLLALLMEQGLVRHLAHEQMPEAILRLGQDLCLLYDLLRPQNF